MAHEQCRTIILLIISRRLAITRESTVKQSTNKSTNSNGFVKIYFNISELINFRFFFFFKKRVVIFFISILEQFWICSRGLWEGKKKKNQEALRYLNEILRGSPLCLFARRPRPGLFPLSLSTPPRPVGTD